MGSSEVSDRVRSEISLRRLRVFESVAQLSSVTRASEEINRSQPAVTHAIAKLEKQLGVALLDRRPSGTYLNAYGALCLRRIRRMFAQIESALDEMGIPAGSLPVSRVASGITRSQILSLTAVAETGSFSGAARSLDISLTQLQRAARGLERVLRTPLYMQTASGVVATPVAIELARKLKLALREWELGIQELEAALGNGGGEIVVGAMLLAGSVVLASALNEFAAAYPNANIRVLNGNAEDMLRCLRCGDVDLVIGLIREPTCPDLVSEVLAETSYVVVARHGHPLTKKGKATLEDIAAYEWVIGTAGAHRRARFDQLFIGRRQPPARVTTCSLPIIRRLLAQSDRLTLLTSYELMFEDEALVAVPFGPIESTPAIGVTMRGNWLPTQIQGRFMELIRKRIVGSAMLADGVNTGLKKLGLTVPDLGA